MNLHCLLLLSSAFSLGEAVGCVLYYSVRKTTRDWLTVAQYCVIISTIQTLTACLLR